jgi:hypothetical protein
MMVLEAELEAFASMKDELLSVHRGKFALIRGGEFLGAFDTAENAYAEGVSRFGREPFLVKRIAEQDETHRNFAYASGLMHARL